MPKLEELIASGDISAAIAELMNGRITPLPDAAENAAQYDPKKHDINDPKIRPDKIVVTDKDSEEYGEVKNINVNAELTTEQKFRIEKVARIALAIQKLIVKRAVAFTFGHPVGYNATPEGDTEKALLAAINRVFHDVKERTVNRKVARSLYSTTEVAEYWYPVETEKPHNLYGFPKNIKFRVALFSPAYGDKLYPYFDDAHDLIAFSRQFTKKGADMITRTYFETFTKDAHYLWKSEGLDGTDKRNWELVEGYPKALAVGKIPVIYAAQPEVEWADVQSLIDRLEKLLSNFADTNDYHASPKIFVQGKILGFARKGEAGAIIEGEDGAKAQYLSWQNAPESVKLEIDTLLRMIYTITQTPDISFDTVKGIGAVSGVALQLLFMDAHLKVQDKTEIFADYLQRRVNLLKAYFGVANLSWAEAADALLVEPEITPYIIEDEQGKINTLQNANGGKPVISHKTSIRRLGWVDDVEAEYSEIQADEERENRYTEGEPTF